MVDGDHDWMDPEGGRESLAKLKAAGNPDARMYIVENAGHHGELCLLMSFFARCNFSLTNVALVAENYLSLP
jgi:hypothetical protein